jgi:hypothetical protein
MACKGLKVGKEKPALGGSYLVVDYFLRVRMRRISARVAYIIASL